MSLHMGYHKDASEPAWTGSCPGCGAYPEEALRGWRLAVDAEFVNSPHILWDGQFWLPCEMCNAKGQRPTPPGALALGGPKEVAPAPSLAEAASAASSAAEKVMNDDHSTTSPRNRQLSALAFYRCVTSDPTAVRPQKVDAASSGVQSGYRLVKLYDDGQAEPVADGRIDEAINFVIARGWKREAFGYWINGAQALVWTQHPWEFERDWAAPLMRCPCRYTRNAARYESKSYVGRLVPVGVGGCIAPTRTGRQVVALRSRFPTFSGDALWAPVEVMEAEQQRMAEWQQRQEPSRLFVGSVQRAVRQTIARCDDIARQVALTPDGARGLAQGK